MGDVSVQDFTGVIHLPGTATWSFASDRSTPSEQLCQVFRAWELLVGAAQEVASDSEPFRYDLVNLGREVLAELSTPMSMNFSDAVFKNEGQPLEAAVKTAGSKYLELL